VGGAIGGKLGDVHGHRLVYRATLLSICVLTALSAIAWDGPSFLAFRVLAGLAAGATSANSSALVLHAFPPEERTRAIGVYQSAMTLAPALGLLLGGPLIDHFGWRSMFVVFTLLVAAGYVWAWKVVEEAGERTPRRIDYLGAATLAAAVVASLMYFDRSKVFGFTDRVPVLMLVAAIGSIALFVLIEWRAAEPLFRLAYFTRRNFIAPTAVTAFLNYAFMGGLVVTPLLLHQQFGYSNTAAASVLFLRPASYAVTAIFAGALQQRFAVRTTAQVGGAVVIASMLLFAVGSNERAIGMIVAGLVLAGFGLGIATPGLTAAAANASDPQDYGVASGMRTTLTQIGVTAGIQSMTIALGTTYTPSAFAGSFVLGCIVAAVGTALAFTIRR
jgi:MFS family permease